MGWEKRRFINVGQPLLANRGAGAQSWEIEKTVYLLWDGYNIVQALIHSQTHTLTNSFTWGLDLSGSLQGAGGVGGLLAEVKDGTPYFAAFDANGNVTEHLSADGDLAAHYEYSPFGEIVVQSGELADSFLHRFSTKPRCAATGMSEYVFRKYHPDLGRWLSRDPIGELGGHNVYGFAGNGSLSFVDPFGLWSLKRLNGMHDSYSKVLEEDFRSLEKDIMPGLKLDIDRVIARAEALPKRCQYRKALFKGLKRVKQTLDEIGSMLSSDEPLNLCLKGRYGRPNPDPPSARTWKSWGTWEMEFNMDDGLYFPQERKQRLGTLFHEHVHVVEGNNQHKGFWDNPYYLAFMVKSDFESFTTAVRSKMVAEEGDECCPTGRDEWPNSP